MNVASQQLPSSVARRSRWSVAAWTTNIVLLVGICAWIIGDGRYSPFAQSMSQNLRVASGIFVLILFALSCVVICNSLFRGTTRDRSLKAWLAFMALVSAWCMLSVSQESLHWLGQTMRSRADIPAYDPIVTELRDHWPDDEREAFELANFTGYPFGAPRTLLMVGPLQVPDAIPIAAIGRSDQGAIRLQLATRAARGLWIKWHPEGSVPESVVDGLQTKYSLLKQSELQPGWYLVRYRAGVSKN